jgi:hypothetical protein
VRRNAVSAPGFDAKSSSVVTMRSNWTKTSKLDGIKRDAVDHYIQNAQKYLKRLQLPLGAKLQPVDTESQPPKWELQLPELRFVSVAIRYGRNTSPSAIPQACPSLRLLKRAFCRPKANVHVTTGPGKLDVITYGASVDVSQSLKGLGLQDRCVS